MELAMLEDFSYTDPQGRIYDSVGNVIREDKDAKKEAYTYIGWKGIEVLQPGQFGVASATITKAAIRFICVCRRT
jgi:hypothetical protein